jgi:hypothetical protein
MPQLLFSGFNLDRHYWRAGIVTGSDPPRARQAADGEDLAVKCGEYLIRDSRLASQSIGRMSVAQPGGRLL